MKKWWTVLCAAALVWLTGCAPAWEEADLVVYNDSAAVIGSIQVLREGWAEGVCNANGAPLERGKSFGFVLEEGAYGVTVELTDPDGRKLTGCRVDWDSAHPDRVYVVVLPDLTVVTGGQAVWDRLVKGA